MHRNSSQTRAIPIKLYQVFVTHLKTHVGGPSVCLQQPHQTQIISLSFYGTVRKPTSAQMAAHYTGLGSVRSKNLFYSGLESLCAHRAA